MDANNEYYNAKPSKIGNIGADVPGARRMNYDTYETTEEREVRGRKKKQDKQIGAKKLELKSEVLSDSPSVAKIIDLTAQIFDLSYGFHPSRDEAKKIIADKRFQANDRDSRADFNRLVNSFNKFKTTIRKLDYNPSYYIRMMREKYQPKGSFAEQSGETYDWKSFKLVSDLKDTVSYLSTNTSAVQFGNSVAENERAYISFELSEFLKLWKIVERLNNIDLSPVNWSFGARGKAGSVAYYQAAGKIISVNRNNIGSLIHELGHYIDHISKHISYNISYKTISDYRDTIKEGLDKKSLNYYCKREEIFARAFEAYCFKIYAGFSKFAQCGKSFLPELNDELIGLIEKALGEIK